MVLQVDACNLAIFRGYRGKAAFKPGIMVAKRPDLMSMARRLRDLVQMILRGLDFVLRVRRVFPHDRRVAADLGKVHHVAIQDNGVWLEPLHRLLEGP